MANTKREYKGENGWVPKTGTKWYACVTLTNGTVHLDPADSESEAEVKLNALRSDDRYAGRIAYTCIKQRNLDNPKYKGGLDII